MPTQVTTNNLLLSITGGASGDNVREHVEPTDAALYHSAGEVFFESEAARERWDTNESLLTERARRWFQNPVTVSTVDHVLSTMVNGYRGATIARGNLLRSVIVFDELHAYDEHTVGHILGALRQLSEMGVPWYVMTATLPPHLRRDRAFDGCETVESDGRLRDDQPPREPFTVAVKSRRLTADRVLDIAADSDAKRVMVVKNTVREARELAQALDAAGREVIYYSSEFIEPHRRKKEEVIRERFSNNAIMELGGVACQKTPKCDEEGCPWRKWCRAYETGDFTAPDVPTQPKFEGSRRQFRGRIVRVLGECDELSLDELGPKIRVDYSPEGNHGREWLQGLLSDLAEDGLVEVDEREGDTSVRLRR